MTVELKEYQEVFKSVMNDRPGRRQTHYGFLSMNNGMDQIPDGEKRFRVPVLP